MKDITHELLVQQAIASGEEGNELDTTDWRRRIEDALDKLKEWAEDAEGAYADNTTKAWRSDWNQFAAFCLKHQLLPLPASVETVLAYIETKKRVCKPETLARHLNTITRIHTEAGEVSPAEHRRIKLRLRAFRRERARQPGGNRKTQAPPLQMTDLDQVLESWLAEESLKGLQGACILSCAYDGKLRESEVARIQLHELAPLPQDGGAMLLIPFSKSDQDGEGQEVYLSPATMDLIEEWLEQTGIVEGALFRPLNRNGQPIINERTRDGISPRTVYNWFKRAGELLGRPLSGHSARVGATIDKLLNGIDMGTIQHEGRWKSPIMPAWYARRLERQRTAGAELVRGRKRHKR